MSSRFQVPVAQHDHMIQAFPSDRADEALDVGVLPGRPVRGQGLPDPQVPHTLPEGRAVGSISIPAAGGEEPHPTETHPRSVERSILRSDARSR